MKMNIKYRKILVSAMILLLLCAYYNVCFNLHYHILDDGRIISHTHPFQKDNDKNQQVPNHTHTQTEFILLDIIFKILSFLSIFILMIVFVLKQEKLLHLISHTHNLKSLIQNAITRRGPPLHPYFI